MRRVFDRTGMRMEEPLFYRLHARLSLLSRASNRRSYPHELHHQLLCIQPQLISNSVFET